MAEYIMKRFDRNDFNAHNLVKEWWLAKRGNNLSDSVVSDSGYLITDDEGVGLAACFFYPVMGCECAMVGFPIANPEIDSIVRQNAIHLLTTVIESDAKRLNYRWLISYAGSKGAVAMFNREGYKPLDTEVTQFGKEL
jgi:hypothetical protein